MGKTMFLLFFLFDLDCVTGTTMFLLLFLFDLVLYVHGKQRRSCRLS